MKSDYHDRQERRRERYEDLADKNAREAESRSNTAHKMGQAIPFGQPILVGHHSEKRDRNYRNRIHQNMEKAHEAYGKADYYAARAAGVGTGGISSDDPQAVRELTCKLLDLEAKRDLMKRGNKAYAYAKKQGWPALGDNMPMEYVEALTAKFDITERYAITILNWEPPYAYIKRPFTYQLTNLGATIRNTKARIEALQKAETLETVQYGDPDGVHVVENVEDNRVQIFFPGKPPAQTRALLKSNGFRWAPSVGAWQRHLINGRYAARRVFEQL